MSKFTRVALIALLLPLLFIPICARSAEAGGGTSTSPSPGPSGPAGPAGPAPSGTGLVKVVGGTASAVGGTGIPILASGTVTVSSTVPPANGGAGTDLSSCTGLVTWGSGTSTCSATLAASKGGTGQNSSAWTGIPTVSAGTWAAASTVGSSLGGLGANNSAASGVPVFVAGAATVTATTGTGNVVRATSPTVSGLTTSGTTTLDSGLSGYAKLGSGVVSAQTGVPAADLTGTVSASNGGTGANMSACDSGSATSWTGGVASCLATTGSGNAVRATSPAISGATLSGTTTIGAGTGIATLASGVVGSEAQCTTAQGCFGQSMSSATGVSLWAAGTPTLTGTTGTGNFARVTAPTFSALTTTGTTTLDTGLTGYAKVAAGVVSAQSGVPASDLTSVTGSGNAVLATSPTITTPAITTSATVTRDAIATTSSDGVVLRNTTPATVGTTIQYSPRLLLSGAGYNSSSTLSEADSWMCEVRPTTANGTTSASFVCARSLNGAAYADELTITSGGALTVPGSIQGANVTAGSGFLITTKSAIAATSTDGVELLNSTAAASGSQAQWSTRVRQQAAAWDGAASRTVEWIDEEQITPGASYSGDKIWSYQAAGGGYNTRLALRGRSGALEQIGDTKGTRSWRTVQHASSTTSRVTLDTIPIATSTVRAISCIVTGIDASTNAYPYSLVGYCKNVAGTVTCGSTATSSGGATTTSAPDIIQSGTNGVIETGADPSIAATWTAACTALDATL